MKFENSERLAERLADVLVKGALYRILSYDGSSCHFASRIPNDSSRYGVLPQQLKIYCSDSRCEQETQWEADSTRHQFGLGFIANRKYTCRNCGAESIHYFFIWQENKNGSLFLKVGQYPALAIDPSPELAKALGTEDADLYKKALINANYNHGLGAVAYFRRVLENKVNLILDLIAEALKIAQVEAEDLKRLEEIKKSHRVEEKIKFASGILPANLKPGGHNPLDKLYRAASGGLHGESDDDCLTIFNEARFVFEYLFKNLTVSNEEAREYVRRLNKPITTKADPKNESEVVPVSES